MKAKRIDALDWSHELLAVMVMREARLHAATRAEARGVGVNTEELLGFFALSLRETREIAAALREARIDLPESWRALMLEELEPDGYVDEDPS